jgi:hypothetical protein
MNLIIGFVPFISYALLVRLSDDLALWVAFAVSFALGMRSFLETRVLKTLDMGSVVLFGALALYKGFVQPGLSFGVELLLVDGTLFVVLLASWLLYEPFTLQYAREQVSPHLWKSPAFLRTNAIVAGVWLSAFTLMTAVDIAAAVMNRISASSAMAAGLVALAAALTFSLSYPRATSLSGNSDSD